MVSTYLPFFILSPFHIMIAGVKGGSSKLVNWNVIPSDPGRRGIVFQNEGTGSGFHRLTHEPCNYESLGYGIFKSNTYRKDKGSWGEEKYN